MVELEPPETPSVPSPICALTLRVHAFEESGEDEREIRCHGCGLVMPVAAALRDGPGARHCISCGWWSPEEECERAGAWCVWCKTPFDE